MHELDGGAGHTHAEGDSDAVYQLDNVELTTIGVDVGSSTFHLIFAKVHLCREAVKLSARYEIVSREILWRSEIALTPYRGRLIDADAVSVFVARCHEQAGLAPEDVDSGAVILTGEALRHQNARALADAIAAGSGKFVCVSAGHHLESMLAAYGSGAAEYTKATGERLLHIDIGGGTTKLATIEGGRALATAAVMIGGRQISWNDRREIAGTTAGARTIARRADVDLSVGSVLSPEAQSRFVAAQCEVIYAIANGEPDDLGRKLRLTPALPKGFKPDAISFSGGVSEYIYGRETAEFGDLGALLGRSLRAGIADGRFPVPIADPGVGIRATVVGASECSVQLTGNTIKVSDPGVLPVYNVPVVHPDSTVSDGAIDSGAVAVAVREAVGRFGLRAEDPVALAFSWQGDPSYERLAAFARGVGEAVGVVTEAPLIVLMDDDIASSVGYQLGEEIGSARPVICLDGLDLSPLDFVDVGSMLEPSGVLPVVIKSLLFGAGHRTKS